MKGGNRPSGRMTGGRAIAEMLNLANPGPIFGMGGFQLLPFYDAVRELGLVHHLINDERSGAFAADAYARVTNKVGLCDATLGPGATNLVTALAESYNAGTPLIAITGDANRLHAHKNMTQETRQTEILRPVVKELIRVEFTSRIPELVRRAFRVATSGRAGPVVIDVPEDVAHGEHEFAQGDFHLDLGTCAVPAHRTCPDSDDLDHAASLIAKAERPVLLAGGGIHFSNAHGALIALAEHIGIPVAHTLSGKGAIACTHPLSAGLFGRYSRFANELIEASDCIIAVGCKLGEIATKRYDLIPTGIPIIHIDIVAEEFGRTTEPTVALWGDARATLAKLLELVRQGSLDRGERERIYLAELPSRFSKWRTEAEARLNSNDRPINIARLISELNHLLPEDAILVADGGFAAHWTGLIFDTKRAGRGYVANRGLASIGYGLPGAIGASLAAPGRTVVAITGDGGLNMTLGDLETALRANLNVIIIVINNAASGYIKALQHAMYDGNYQSCDLFEMNYAAIAKAMGCRSVRIEDPNELRDQLAKLISEPAGPTIVDVVVTRDPAQMLPAVDSRTVKIKRGDRIA